MRFEFSGRLRHTRTVEMKHWKRGQLRLAVALGVALSMLAFGHVYAQSSTPTSTSSNYGVTEVQFGSGGSLQDCSSNYCAKTSAGDLVDGSGSSGNYSAQFGFNTSDEPMLEVTTTSGANNLGVLDTGATATATGTITVRSYLSSGYVIAITGRTPTNGTHSMIPLIAPTLPTPGTEQFGINLVDNSSPDVGANPEQVPESSFSFGNVKPNYNQENEFMYISGDPVAYSNTSSGQTKYTMSMILNISNATPGGAYKGDFSAVVVPVF
jgi:hypothetical protein